MLGEGVTERDKLILRLIYEEQFISLRLISKFYFNDSFQSASLRMIKLIDSKFLKYEKLGLPSQPKVLRLTPSGIKVARSVSPYQVKQKRKIAISTLVHDGLVSEARLNLLKRFDADWIPEKAMKHHALKKIPDGILLFPSKLKIAVEVENTIKSKPRYDEMWRE